MAPNAGCPSPRGGQVCSQASFFRAEFSGMQIGTSRQSAAWFAVTQAPLCADRVFAVSLRQNSLCRKRR